MRLELVFELEKPQIIVDNKSVWISYLKHVISNCNDGKYFNLFFENSIQKNYSFATIFSKPKYEENIIKLADNTVKMIFSASDKEKTGLIFYSAFIANKNKMFLMPDNNKMILKTIRQIKEKTITSSKILIKTVVGGGLVVREHDKVANKDVYYTVEDECFEKEAKKVLVYQAEKAGFSKKIAEEINIVPIDCKKIVVKQYGVFIDVTKGVFLLEGNPDLLQYYYQAGIGSKHSMGYGLIDVIAQDIE